MTATFLESSPSPLPNKESTIAHESSIALARHIRKGEDLKIRVVDDEEEETIVVPAPAVALLLGILRMTARGQGIALTPLHSELTTSQAADMLNVSRPYLIKLLDAGDIPHHKVGRHRRIRREDVMEFAERSRIASRAAMDELVALSEELGLYDV